MCKRVYGYARISRATQNIDRQVRNILQYKPSAIIYKEAYTGRSINRPQFDKMLKQVQAGDVIIFDSVSRMSRSAADGVRLYFDLYDKGVSLVFLKERHLDTESYRDALSKAGINIDIAADDSAENVLVSRIIDAVNEFMKAKVAADIEKGFSQAEKEVSDLRERTSEGIETARRAGKQIGQKQGAKLTTKKSIAAKETIKKYSRDFNGTLSDADVIKLAAISRNTYYQYKRQLRAEQQ